jgi:spore maturation protein CgeB
MKILILAKNYENNVVWQQTAFFKEIVKITNATLYGEGFEMNLNNTNLSAIIEDYDIIVCNTEDAEKFKETKNIKIGIITDLHANPRVRGIDGVIQELNTSSFNFIFFRAIPKYLKENLKKKYGFLPFSVDEDVFKYSEDKTNDIFFTGNKRKDVYPLRYKVLSELEMFCKINRYSFIYSKRAPLSKKELNFFDSYYKDEELIKKYKLGIEYVKTLQQSKIAIFDSSIYKYPVQKYFECMATGCLILADVPLQASNIGLIDKETFVKIDSFNWKEKVKYYLDKNKEREKIIRNANKKFLMKHTHKIRVQEFLNQITD